MKSLFSWPLLVAALSTTTTSAWPTSKSKAPVCIIGAGPAGLTAANNLESKGYETVIFEKQSEVGGKSQAYYDDRCVCNFFFFLSFFFLALDRLIAPNGICG